MRNLLLIFMALATFAMNAQDKNKDLRSDRKDMKTNMTSEQRADLRTKKMTLILDLDTSQQEMVKQLYLEMSNDRPAMSKNRNEMTDSQKYEAKSAILDRRIAFKNEMKEILTEEQIAKWEDLQSERIDSKGGRSDETKPRMNHKNKL